MTKKAIRARFRQAVFSRDGYCCCTCGVRGVDRQEPEVEDGAVVLDAHHITDRSLMPHGGYVRENGITLCGACHRLAEQFWQTGVAAPGFSPEALYARIGSSAQAAQRAAERL